MKRTILSSLIVTLAFATAGVSAAEQATLQIKGKIVPGACGITLSDGGIIDYKTITAAMLDKDGKPTNLDVKTLTVNIKCEQKMPVGFSVQDNRADSAASGDKYPNHVMGQDWTGKDLTWVKSEQVLGLGKAHNGAYIGSSRLVAVKGGQMIDAKPATLLSNSGGLGKSITGIMSANGKLHHMLSSDGSANPSAGLDHELKYNVLTTLAPKGEHDMSKAVELDGNATFTVVYM